MRIAIFGLSISSSWGNGHATIWRGLIKELARLGHSVRFFERDVPYYSGHRDLSSADWVELTLYKDWDEIAAEARKELRGADAAIVTSYCPDGVAATDLVLSSLALKVFYDLDTPVTLKKAVSGEGVAYIGPGGLGGFDLVLSYTGGSSLDGLKSLLGARRVAPLYGSVDPEAHRPVDPVADYSSDLSYLGTWSEDRHRMLVELFVEPSKALAGSKFILGGSLYPQDFPWTKNIFYLRHVPPPSHPAFYSSSAFTLNVTRGVMAEAGWCPSGRLFEAAACGTPVISDWWEGLDEFFTPGSEILIARDSGDVIEALRAGRSAGSRISKAARERTLEEHTSANRARELEALLEGAFG